MDRNAYLNPAFKPRWKPVDNPESASLVAMNPMGDTRFDPFQGTPWGHFFDSLKGARVGKGSLSSLPDSPPAPSITSDERANLQGPFGSFSTGTGGLQPDPSGAGPEAQGPYGPLKPVERLTKAVRGIK